MSQRKPSHKKKMKFIRAHQKANKFKSKKVDVKTSDNYQFFEEFEHRKTLFERISDLIKHLFKV